MSFGRTVIGTQGPQIAVSADGAPEWKLGGITIDWSGVTASSGETLADGTVLKNGDKYLRYGTVLSQNASGGLFAPTGTTTPAAGQTVVLNETVILDAGGLINADNRGAIEGGRVWEDRLLVGESDQPTLAELLAACPRLQLVHN